MGVKGEYCSVDVAPGGYVMARVFDGFNRPGDGMMLIMLFNILVKCHGLFDNPAPLKSGPCKCGY